MSSREYHRSSSSRDALPPIRDVLGDQLDSSPHRENAYSFDAINRALPDTPSSRSRSTWPQSTGPTLPPIHGHHARSHGYATAGPPTPTYTSHSHHSSSYTSHTHPTSHTSHTHAPSSHHAQHPSSHAPAPAYSFDVFRPSSSGLVHASSSSRSQGILRSTRVDAGRRGGAAQLADDDRDEDHDRDGERERDESSKKYVCTRCGKRFGRPSSLKTHEVVHSDEKPFTCPHPGCLKTFTVASNMRRHFRKMHESHGASADWDEGEEEEYYASGSGSGGRGYYTSSRR